jgi:hypothetical protein
MIPVLTQPCQDQSLVPIDVVAADSKGILTIDLTCGLHFHALFKTLLESLREHAPQGTARLYNFRYEYKHFRGLSFLRGTADAYGQQVIETTINGRLKQLNEIF